jgi:hypothetical protein
MRVSLMAVGAWQYFFGGSEPCSGDIPPSKILPTESVPTQPAGEATAKTSSGSGAGFHLGPVYATIWGEIAVSDGGCHPDIWIPRNDHFPNSCATQGRFEDLVMF